MRRAMIFAYGLLCYGIFLVSFVYAVGFVANAGVPKSIDTGPAGGALTALLVDAALLSLFALQHSGMARRAFKRRLTRLVPPAAERSTYVLASSLILLAMFWLWRPLPSTIWAVRGAAARDLLWAVYVAGWATVLFGTFMISHTQLFGLAQVWARLRGRRMPRPQLQTRYLYRFVRHPLMLGFMIAFWATPDMTVGHLLFAAGSTGYIFLATLALEERDLERTLGAPYRRYRERVPAFLPHIGHGVDAADLADPSDALPQRQAES